MAYPQTTRATDIVAQIKAATGYSAAHWNVVRLILLQLTEYDLKAILNTTFS